jgi:competence protein ComEA
MKSYSLKRYSIALLALVLFAAAPLSRAATPPAASASAVPAPARVNINSASAEELQSLKGIGPRTAAAIITWRQQEGPFKSVDQLLAIKGIGEKTLARFRDRLSL